MARSARDGATQVKIELPKMLLVEGESELRFIAALLGCLDLSDEIQILNYGGKPKLRPFLFTLSRVPGYPDLESLGITRDADKSFASTFESIRNALVHAGLDAPDQPRMLTLGKPSVSVFVLPDCSSRGMLETLCLSAVKHDPATPCVEQYLQCLEETANLPSRNPDKARAHAFLASRARPELRVGEAAQAGHWNLDSPVFDPLKSFLLAL